VTPGWDARPEASDVQAAAFTHPVCWSAKPSKLGTDHDGRGDRHRWFLYWHGQSTFVGGAQETCRDFGHSGCGRQAMAHVAETAWHQGVNLPAGASYFYAWETLTHANG
jgi:hypothetical protein